jgi:hypothetical protein
MAGLVFAVLVPSIFFGSGGATADGPAVSEPHPPVGASISAIGADGTDVQVFLADAAYYRPVGESFGLELSVSAGLGVDEGDAKEAVGGGGALFWRDPTADYVGAEASGSHFGSFDRWGAGAFGGWYRGNWDFGGSGGLTLMRQLREDRL